VFIGKKPKIGIDKNPNSNADVIRDLNKLPLPIQEK